MKHRMGMTALALLLAVKGWAVTGGVDPGDAAQQDTVTASVALGAGSSATGLSATALSAGSLASGERATALGSGALASSPGATANGSAAIAAGAQSVAVGAASAAAGSGSVALGAGALAANANAVALGANSTTDRDNSVSVGDAASGLKRQITNVAPGTMDSDAATVGQLRAQQQGGQRFAIQQAQSAGAVVAAAADAAMAASAVPGDHKLAIGAGTLGGQAGFGLAYQQRFGGISATFTGAGNGNNDYTHFGAGAAIGW